MYHEITLHVGDQKVVLSHTIACVALASKLTFGRKLKAKLVSSNKIMKRRYFLWEIRHFIENWLRSDREHETVITKEQLTKNQALNKINMIPRVKGQK